MRTLPVPGRMQLRRATCSMGRPAAYGLVFWRVASVLFPIRRILALILQTLLVLAPAFCILVRPQLPEAVPVGSVHLVLLISPVSVRLGAQLLLRFAVCLAAAIRTRPDMRCRNHDTKPFRSGFKPRHLVNTPLNNALEFIEIGAVRTHAPVGFEVAAASLFHSLGKPIHLQQIKIQT